MELEHNAKVNKKSQKEKDNALYRNTKIKLVNEAKERKL